MKRQQIIIIVLAVLSVAGLYSLPRIVVNNKEDEPQGFADASTESTGINHSAEIPSEVLPLVDKWKSELLAGTMMTDNEAALDSLMRVFQSVNKYDSAAHYAGRYAQTYPEADHWRKAGNAYFEAFNFAVDEAKTQELASQATRFYNKILEAGVNDLGVKNNLAMMLVNTTNPMRGIMMLREILAEDPENEKALYNMGIMSVWSRQFEKALERFEKLVSIYPNHLEGNFYLGLSYFETGHLEKAKAQLEKLKQMDSNEAVLQAVDEYLGRIEVKN